MKKYSVRILTTSNELYVYTTERESEREAVNAAGMLYRFSGHSTDVIQEIAVREIR